LEGPEEAGMMSFARESLHFISHAEFGLQVWSWFSCSPLLAFEVYIQAEGICYRNEDFNKAFLSSFIYFT